MAARSLHRSMAGALLCTCALLSACAGGQNWGDAAVENPFATVDYNAGDVPIIYDCNTIDILFVIDNSETMFQEQQALGVAFGALIQAIESLDPPLATYRIGVISTDVGAGPYTFGGTSTCHEGGDEGLLQHTPRGEGCPASLPLFLQAPSGDLERDFACIASLGLTGCGFEQPMESALKALTEQPGNDGFLRFNAPLAIIFISDEDDCSAADTGLFDPTDLTLGTLKTRCVAHKELLHPISRYVSAFKALRSPEHLVVAAVTGPPGKVQIDEDRFAGQVPICTSNEFGEAAAGNRFNELVSAFGVMGKHVSICEGNFAAAMDKISLAIRRICLL
ncbi:MAG: hypothetical protein JRH20_16585 [Deltaproteobacteria bacterium]|nr:hypothetical protein [Deltaproteobacteria bacterium]